MVRRLCPSKTSPKDRDFASPWWAVFTFSTAFFFVYTSFEALQNLQSSLHHTNNLGSISLGLLYTTNACLSFLAAPVLHTIGLKACICIIFTLHTIYVLSNFYPTFPILLTASVALGAGLIFCLAGIGVYLTGVAQSYIRLRNLTQDETHGVASMFNGIFYFFFKGTHVLGNVLSSAILSRSDYNMTTAEYNVCGAYVCPDSTLVSKNDSNIVIVSPEKSTVYTLLFVFLSFDVLGLFILLTLTPFFNISQQTEELSKANSTSSSSPPSPSSSLSSSTVSSTTQLSTTKESEKKSQGSTFRSKMSASSKIFVDFRYLLLAPLYIGQAMVIMMLYSSYTEAFVSCAIGIKWVGYAMLFLGISGAMSSVLVNSLAKYVGRIPLFLTAIFIDIGCLITMLLWQPNDRTSPVALFILPFLGGFSEGIFQPQQIALTSSIFGEQKAAAFSAISATRCLAFSFTLYSLGLLCVYHQFALALTFYLIGFMTYIVTEIRENRLKAEKPRLKTETQSVSPDVMSSTERKTKGYGSLQMPLAKSEDSALNSELHQPP